MAVDHESDSRPSERFPSKAFDHHSPCPIGKTDRRGSTVRRGDLNPHHTVSFGESEGFSAAGVSMKSGGQNVIEPVRCCLFPAHRGCRVCAGECLFTVRSRSGRARCRIWENYSRCCGRRRSRCSRRGSGYLPKAPR